MEMQEKETCYWVRADGTRCIDSRLVPDSKYCHRHYWQALWTKTALAATPLPSRVDWLGLGFLAIIAVAYWLGNMHSPDWVFPTWLNTLNSLLRNPRLGKDDPLLIAYLLGWFSVQGTTPIIWWSICLVNCYYPLRARTRRAQILVALICYGILIIGEISASILSLVNGQPIRPAWLASIVVDFAVFPWILGIFWAADTFNPRILTSKGPALFIALSFGILITSVAGVVLGERAGELLFIRLVSACFGILVGLLLLRSDGRILLTELLSEQVAKLADALRPMDIPLLGSGVETSNARNHALQKALAVYSNLTPAEQEELEIYIVIKRRPSTLQVFLGLVAIALSAFFLEAPAQQAFVWFACDLLRLGIPFCP